MRHKQGGSRQQESVRRASDAKGKEDAQRCGSKDVVQGARVVRR